MSGAKEFNEVKEATKQALREFAMLSPTYFKTKQGQVYKKFTENNSWGFVLVTATMPGFDYHQFAKFKDIFASNCIIKKYVDLGGNIYKGLS